MTPKLTINIATYNRGKALRRTLDSLAAMNLAPELWELLVVNNNSTDDTLHVLAEFSSSHPDLNVRTVDETRQGLSYARNCGIENARGEIMAIIDDDVEVNAGFASAYLDFFEKYPQAIACGGCVTPLYETGKPQWMSRYTERPIAGTINLGDGIRPFGHLYPTGANMGFRRSALLDFGGFNTSLGRNADNPMGGEEKDLFMRLKKAGHEIYFVPGARVLHIIPPYKLTPEYFERVATMCGRSERVRTLAVSRAAYVGRLCMEAVKWGATLAIAACQTVSGHISRARALVQMRRCVTRGLIDKS